MNTFKNISMLVIGLGLLAIAAVGWLAYDHFRTPDPETIVSTSLEAFKEQNRLVPFTARFVSIATTSNKRLGFRSQKTLILPGTVRYELDLSKLERSDLSWDESAGVLTITLPPIELGGPEFGADAPQEYVDGEFILYVTGDEPDFDRANRQAARADIIKQARAETPMQLARTAAIKAVETNFILPLRAVGIDAEVRADFAE